jgi:glycogen debranching enzyme
VKKYLSYNGKKERLLKQTLNNGKITHKANTKIAESQFSKLHESHKLINRCRKSSELVLNRVIGRYKNEQFLAKQDLIFTAGPKSHFYEQIWTRDTSLSIINIIAEKYPIQAFNTLNLLFDYQKVDGTLPVRIEGNRHWMHFVPGFRNVNFLINRKKPFAVYTNRLHSPEPRDDIPMTIIAWQSLFHLLMQDEELLEKRWQQMLKAVQKEESFERNGLIHGERFQDWVDSIHRKGKLSNINILFYRALEAMWKMAKQINKREDAMMFAEKTEIYKEKIMQTFWEDKYFKAGTQDNRFDSFANILATLFLVSPDKAVKIQDSIIEKKLIQNGLLRNFDRPYPADYISKFVKLGKMEDYHNHYSWPWITSMNIIAKLKIAKDHPNLGIKKRFQSEAIEDFIKVSEVFKEYGFCEILDEKTELPVDKHYHFGLFEISSYKSSPDFLISATVYLQALEKLSSAGLI